MNRAHLDLHCLQLLSLKRAVVLKELRDMAGKILNQSTMLTLMVNSFYTRDQPISN